jgi:cobalt-zinc-cadmium efflux system membrane fusion protein
LKIIEKHFLFPPKGTLGVLKQKKKGNFMKKRNISHIVLLMAAFTMSWWLYGCGGHNEEEKEHAHEEGAKEAPKVSHKGEAPGTHEGEPAGVHEGEAPGAHSGEEGEVEISPEAIKMAGITLAKAGIGKITGSIDLSGEVGFNEDRLVHITPRFPGIAKEAHFRVGDFVKEGDVVAVIESNESMTSYSLEAPLSGRIIEKHISPGEHVSETESIYLLADLSNVWVNLAVYPKDASKVKTGQRVSISVVGTNQAAEGTIRYVTPVMDPQTRRITARVVLQNGSNEWRPGAFVNAHIEAGEVGDGLVVDKDAVQILNNKPVVFISDEPNCFRPVEVTTGESDSRRIRILTGLESGTEYVNNGAFELKAKIVTSSLGGHAGHGH